MCTRAMALVGSTVGVLAAAFMVACTNLTYEWVYHGVLAPYKAEWPAICGAAAIGAALVTFVWSGWFAYRLVKVGYEILTGD